MDRGIDRMGNPPYDLFVNAKTFNNTVVRVLMSSTYHGTRIP